MRELVAPPHAQVVRLDMGRTVEPMIPAWRRLLEETGETSPFWQPEWHMAWAETEAVSVHLLQAWFADGRLAALLPLQWRRRRGLRQLEFLGQESGAIELDCLLHPDASAAVAESLLQGLLAHRGWDLCRLRGLPAAGNLARTRWAAAAEPDDLLPYLPLPRGWDEFLNGQSANFRAEIRRRRRRWEARGGALAIRRDPDEIAAAMATLFDLHNRRRRQKAGRGMFEDARLRRFHLRVAADAARRGSARLYCLRLGEQIIAALYGWVAGARFYYFQSGLAPEWAHESPGTVLLSHVIEDCIRGGVTQFEFLQGNEGYKGRWTNLQRQSLDLCLARGWRGGLYRPLRTLWRRHAARHRRPAGKDLAAAIPGQARLHRDSL